MILVITSKSCPGCQQAKKSIEEGQVTFCDIEDNEECLRKANELGAEYIPAFVKETEEGSVLCEIEDATDDVLVLKCGDEKITIKLKNQNQDGGN